MLLITKLERRRERWERPQTWKLCSTNWRYDTFRQKAHKACPMKKVRLNARTAHRLYRSSGKPVLQESVVGFFDILGLRSQIANANFPAAHQALLRSVHTALHRSISHLKPRNFLSVPPQW